MKTPSLILKPILLFVFSILFVLNVHAQKRIDVVQLKNGNVLKGTIVRQVPGKFIELKTLDKNFWKFDMEDIAEIRYEKKRLAKFETDSIIVKKQSVFFEMKAGVLAGNKGNNNDAPFSLLCTANYLLKNGVSLGGGLGYEAFDEAHLPVFGEIKYHTQLKGLNSYLFCLSGYSFALDDRGDGDYYYGPNDIKSKGGWMINPGIGLMFGNKSNMRYSFSLGYRYQKAKHEWFDEYRDDREYLKEKYHRLSIHLGIIF
ncbi:hypothetical protein DF185_09095 [Marinifilum breve]|uniref:Outer membrane protein beta-barrel domain-containing protein n=1 Tax=Marinifilum breve TaxID=2184082 RepID=A0A2V4A194_9BACT|nr:hypothetical protein [Marinifilum breve]PXY01617.1 hypothetical protein DF185_09095 [Marinifilum breve]